MIPSGDDIRRRVTAKLIGHVILWIHSVDHRVDLSSLGEPWAGMCSNPETNAQVADRLVTPPDLIWLYLSELEDSWSKESKIFQRRWDRLQNSRYPVIRQRTAYLHLIKAIRAGQLRDMPQRIQGVADTYLETRAAIGEEWNVLAQDEIPQDVEASELPFSLDLFAGALLIPGISDRMALKEVLSDWKTNAKNLGAKAIYLAWLKLAEDLLSSSLQDLRKIQSATERDRDERLLANVLLALEENLDPEIRFNVHCVLVTLFSEGAWKEAFSEHLARRVERDWRKHARNPATLKLPRLNVPRIEAAVREAAVGWTKAARVLLAASEAVSTSLPPEVRAKLLTLASEPER